MNISKSEKIIVAKWTDSDRLKLEQRLFPSVPRAGRAKDEPALPDWSEIQRQFRGKGVTLMLP